MTDAASTPDPAAAGDDAGGGPSQPQQWPGQTWLSDEDVLALLDGLGVAGTHDPDEDQEAILAAELSARGILTDGSAETDGHDSADEGSAASPVLVAEYLPAGPGLAAILAQDPPADASDWDLPGLAAGYRQLAAWAQARELAAVAEIAARRAAGNPKIGAGQDGRPRSLPPEAAAEVALELAMTQPGASAWTALGCQLRWALPATGAALADGRIDLPRARIIAEATSLLTGQHAAQVEARVLPAAGGQTTGQLRAAARRAVLAVDPDGAEQRRRDTERSARIGLYPGEEGTATLTGSCLPGVQAAAAMARITAMARALKAAGAHGGLDLLRAHIFLGLLLDTLPLIPPPPGAPPDNPPPPDNGPPADDGPPVQPGDGGTRAGTPAGGGSSAPDGGAAPDGGSPLGPAPDSGSSAPDGGSPALHGGAADDDSSPADAPEDRGPSGAAPDSSPARDTTADRQPDLDAEQDPDDMDGLPGWWPDIPSPGDADAPPDDGDPPDAAAALASQPDDIDDDWPQLPPPDWPPLPPQLPAPPGLSAAGDGARLARTGLLDVLIPWTALAGYTCEPAILGRIGPITSRQAQQLVMLAARGPATQWRVIITSDDGRALAVHRARPPRHTHARDTDPHVTGVIGRVTITIRASTLGTAATTTTCPPVIRDIAATALDAAARAAARAQDHAWQDAAAAGGCAHAMASEAYRPPTRIREHVAARDCTCRFGPCGQPAWRTDIDHTIAWHTGGPTCPCNLGGCCRTHHKIKQLPGWHLEQPQPGTFRWTTPAGRSYLVEPDPYPV